ncbi:hypothetical protein [Roseovarius sp. THAF27]|nr:hypothetical protein [Roseovarius sp. THAF27]
MQELAATIQHSAVSLESEHETAKEEGAIKSKMKCNFEQLKKQLST